MGSVKKVIGKTVGKIFGVDSSAAQRAAQEQAAAIRQASAAQVAQINQQAQGAAYAQQHAANQANLAAKLRTQEQANAQAPTTRIEGVADSPADPRRKYRAAGAASAATGGGIGIRLT